MVFNPDDLKCPGCGSMSNPYCIGYRVICPDCKYEEYK